jgi:archaeosine synthase beta-subunit
MRAMLPERLKDIAITCRADAERDRQKHRLVDARSKVHSWFAPAMLHGMHGHELVIILATRGCQHYFSDELGCTMCGYNNDSTGGLETPESIEAQLESALQKHENDMASTSDVVAKIFNSGSFFDEDEIPVISQEAIIKRLAGFSQVKEIAVESRPEFITSEATRCLKSNARENQHIEVGIGLESWNDDVRLDLINKGFTREQFLQAHELLKENGIGTKAYVLLKPLFLDEVQAYEDARETISQLQGLGVSTISINPVAIHAHTLVEEFWERNSYRPPWLWTVALLVHETFTMPSRNKDVLVLCDPVAGGKPRGPHNCKDATCNQRVLDVIKNAIYIQDTIEELNPLASNDTMGCNCFLEWIDQMHL